MRTAEDFNDWYPVGTPVILSDDFGEDHQTVTRSAAWEVGGTPVVMVTGRSGGYDLGRIKVMETHRSPDDSTA